MNNPLLKLWAESSELRTDLLAALGAIAEDPAALFRFLIQLSGNSDSQVRRAVLLLMGRVPSPSTDIVCALIDALSDEDPTTRNIAADLLPAISPSSFQCESIARHLAAKVDSTDENTRHCALVALANVGSHITLAIPAIARALRDSSANIRWQALLPVRRIGPAGVALLSEFTSLLSDPYPAIRIEAAIALGSIGPSAASATAGLENLLADAHEDVQFHAAAALARIDPTVLSYMPVLLKALEFGKDLAVAAADALQACGPFALDTLPLIVASLHSQEDDENKCLLAKIARSILEQSIQLQGEKKN